MTYGGVIASKIHIIHILGEVQIHLNWYTSHVTFGMLESVGIQRNWNGRSIPLTKFHFRIWFIIWVSVSNSNSTNDGISIPYALARNFNYFSSYHHCCRRHYHPSSSPPPLIVTTTTITHLHNRRKNHCRQLSPQLLPSPPHTTL